MDVPIWKDKTLTPFLFLNILIGELYMKQKVYQVYYLSKHFLRVFSKHKFNFIFSLLVPIFGVLYQQKHIMFEKVDSASFLNFLSIWISYMVAMSGLTIGSQLVTIREQNFLKQFTFVTRDYRLILLAEIITQFIILLTTTGILVLISSIVFSVPLFHLMLLSYGIIFLSFIPISLLFLIFNVFKFHIETMQPITTILTGLFIFMTNFFTLTSSVQTLYIVTNPMLYSLEIGKIVLMLFTKGIPINWTAIIIATIFYCAVGFYSIRHTKITAIFRA